MIRSGIIWPVALVLVAGSSSVVLAQANPAQAPTMTQIQAQSRAMQATQITGAMPDMQRNIINKVDSPTEREAFFEMTRRNHTNPNMRKDARVANERVIARDSSRKQAMAVAMPDAPNQTSRTAWVSPPEIRPATRHPTFVSDNPNEPVILRSQAIIFPVTKP